MLKRSVTCPSDLVAEGDDWTCFTNLNVADRQPPTQNLHLCLYAREKEQVDAFPVNVADRATWTLTGSDTLTHVT